MRFRECRRRGPRPAHRKRAGQEDAVGAAVGVAARDDRLRHELAARLLPLLLLLLLLLPLPPHLLPLLPPL